MDNAWELLLNNKNDDREKATMIGIYMTIPFILAVPPVMGWLIGSWLDKYFNTIPWITYVLIILGFAAGIREFYRILKKYSDF